MLAVARDKMRGLDEARRIRLMAADALALPFETRTFACVTSAFLLRNLADLEQGLREMRRGGRPGGPAGALGITPTTAPGVSPLFPPSFPPVGPRGRHPVGGDRRAPPRAPPS